MSKLESALIKRGECYQCADGTLAYSRLAVFCESCLTGRCPASVEMAVKRAVNQGHLRPVRECVCVDCGAPARHYDHRDYNEPLAVEPVCASCNRRRPPAIGYRRAK